MGAVVVLAVESKNTISSVFVLVCVVSAAVKR